MDDPLLLALGDVIRKEVSADELLQHVVQVMAERLGADRGTIFVFDRGGQELVSVAGELPELPEIRVPVGQGVAGYVARTGKVVNIPYCVQDTHFWPQVDAQTGYRTRTMLAGPLRDEAGVLIGVVQFLNKGGPAAAADAIFDDGDVAIFQGLCAQVSALLGHTTLAQSGSSSPERPVTSGFNRIVGLGSAMQAVYARIRKVAPTEATVLLRGESGTGKGLVARAIHHSSKRRAGPFVHLDCTTLPESLIENELFGHEAGAYTGARERRRGKVELANRGTLFVDEIGDMPLALQSKLLTVLQDHKYTRLGGSETLTADLRIVAATNRNLERLVRDGLFREDLYYRLRVVEIGIPPLRERGQGDRLRLIEHFVAVAAKRHGKPIDAIHPDALRTLLEHSFPGNVRELENCLESAVIFCEGEIRPSHLGLPRRGATLEMPALQASLEEGAQGFDREPSLKELEARYLQYLLTKYEGNRSQCARVLGIGRNTLLRKIKDYDLES
jgi:Nif-specific regulatory protein